MKNPSVIAQHSKTMAGDHDLNRDGDAIVIGLQHAAETASGGIRSRMLSCSARGCGQNAQLPCPTPHR